MSLEPAPTVPHAETLAAYAGHRDSPRMAELAAPLSRQPHDTSFETSLRWLIDGFSAEAST